ncbi:hypothetical protein TVAG_255110 [Trichomonas vaginalis G3]|uniref:Methyltransferase domain-containing protein n=1 Tax=Trichomonas vaginalis (strain ATCC PRA-98 / G3) TaxID=412133 RepID=A2FPX1_TRIV3|nr:methyltransferase protein [Trichomonas vaginalis G3]EAX93030.1 hypothetical protein TVAG_255110 [Trichomonas vaginalis G3]KAI5543776.1 methyltransferase protein [Trichomonas vaginalis G3]|eukprot:XP_001305960.1 hypothetical protein [Trichomonas vaginalis G3]
MDFNYEEEVEEINYNIPNDEEDDRLAKEVEQLFKTGPVAFVDSSYWDQRYTDNPKHFEWYLGFDHFLPEIKKFVPLKGIAANIGCGTSIMGMELIDAGFTTVDNTDISHVAIDHMKELFKDVKNVNWILDDCTNTKLEKNHYDVIFDKGTLDALICCDDPDDILNDIFKGVINSLKPGGYFVEISFGCPEERQEYFDVEGLNWNQVIICTLSSELTKTTPYFIYIYRKNFK